MVEKVQYNGFEVSPFDQKVYITDTSTQSEEQYVVHTETIVHSLLSINGRKGSITVTPDRRMFRRYRQMSSPSNSNSVVSTRLAYDQISNTYQALVDIVEDTAAQLRNSDYWNGYHDGSGKKWDTIVTEYVIDNAIDVNMLLELGKMFVDWDMVPCNEHNAFFKIGDWKRTTGSYVYNEYAGTPEICDNCGADLSKHKTVASVSESTRTPTTYRCSHCGERFESITTG